MIKIMTSDDDLATVEQGKEGLEVAGSGVGNVDGDWAACHFLKEGREEGRAG